MWKWGMSAEGASQERYDDLVRRLMQSDTERPLLVDASGKLTEKAVRARIKELLARRETFYSRAHVTIDRAGQEIPETVEAVLQAIRSYDPGKITGFD